MRKTSHCFTRCRWSTEASTFSANSELTSFSLDSLTTIGGDLFIWDNAALCQTLVEAFVEAMTALGWSDDLYIVDHADC